MIRKGDTVVITHCKINPHIEGLKGKVIQKRDKYCLIRLPKNVNQWNGVGKYYLPPIAGTSDVLMLEDEIEKTEAEAEHFTLGVKQCSERYECHEATWRKWVKEGKAPRPFVVCQKNGGRWLLSDLEKWEAGR